MKISDRIFRFLVSFMCGSAVAVGNIFCLTTAFDIPVDSDLLILLCVSASLLYALAYVFKRAWVGVSIVSVLVIGLCVYNWSSVFYGIILAVKMIMEQFIAAYDDLSGITVIANVPVGTMATSFMALLGALLSLLTIATVSRKYILLPIALASILRLVPCMLIIDSMPDVWAFVLLVGAYILLIMTQLRRRHSKNGQYLLTFVMTLPIIVFVAVIINAVQPETYVRSQNMLDLRERFKTMTERYALFNRDELTDEIEFISPIVEETLGAVVWNDNVSETDLSAIGPQTQTGISVMSVYSDRSETYYLKGNSLGVYGDNTWTALDEGAYEGVPITEGLWISDGTAWSELEIHTNSRSSIIYSPYMAISLPENSEIYYDSYISNTNSVVEYSFPVGENIPSREISPEYEAFVHEVYTQVPDETRAALSEITEQLAQEAWMNWDQDPAAVVAEYVRESAVYDLNTPQMPDDKDFVTWFLNESDTGYCVHFASAATVLLRCMDIPARYVTGYLVTAQGGRWTTVTQDDAHAWVEYYTDGYGWRKLEPTPSAFVDISVPEQTAPVEEEREEVPGPAPVIPNEDGDASQKHGISPFVWIALAVIGGMVLWCPVIHRIRAAVLKKGTYNERAAKYYRRVIFLSKLAKKPISRETEELAMKARFSQHLLTKEELKMLKDRYSELCTELRKDKRPHRYVLYHFVLALPKA